MREMTLSHFNVCTSDLAASKQFYTDVVGLKSGPRPDFPNQGAWMYSGDSPLVHLTQVGEGQSCDMGSIDHIAFELRGLDEFVGHLKGLNVPFEQKLIPGGIGTQVFVTDPSSVRLEFNFMYEAE